MTGTTYADEQCYPCPAGTFLNATGGSQCSPCHPNTFSSEEGAAQCTRCGDSDFSFAGSKSCQPRSPCREADWYPFYTQCINGRHDLEYRWLEPKICSEDAPTADRKPPGVAGLDCANCNPGYTRNQYGICEACPANQIAISNSVCQSCRAGTVGRRDFAWLNFEEFPAGVAYSTRCEGTCGSSGWRLAGRYLDSGIGHGSYVDVSFTLPLSLVAAGAVSFDFSFVCERSCHLSFVDELVLPDGGRQLLRSRSYYSFWSDSGLVSHPTVPGEHVFTWYFSQYDPMLLARNDRILIHSINVTDVAAGQGGASQCVPCSAGMKANATAATCQPCAAGSSSDSLASECTSCPQNTFAETPGSRCVPCGAGSISAPGSAVCTATCQYAASPSVSYDLNPLRSANGTVGPIVALGSQFRFSVCEPKMGSQCIDEDGVRVQSFVCQTEQQRGADAGHIMEFLGGANGTGVTVRYSRGTAGCGYRDGSNSVARSTEINFICDPDAGVGQIAHLRSFRCSYSFEWRTLFACPVCTPNDYDFFYTDCVNGKRDAVYFWKDNPKRCHGGVSLPTTTSSVCSVDEAYVCGPGQRKVDTCVDCDGGSYSLGGASISTYWPNLPDNFRTFCSGCRALWAPRGAYVESGSTGSVLQAIFTFVRAGNLTFTYTAVLSRGEYLQTTMDGAVIVRDRRWSALREFTVDIFVPKAGVHVFAWELRRNSSVPSSGLSGYVRMSSVIAVGTRFHDLACTKCPVGFHQPADGASSCRICPANTFADQPGRTECKPCDTDKWAPPGAASCTPKPECTSNDYAAVFSSCVDVRSHFASFLFRFSCLTFIT